MSGTPLTRAQKDSASIDDYAEDIQKIWPTDKTRPVLLQWLIVVAHASALAEEVRKSAWDKVVHEVAEVFVWWLSFILRIRECPQNESDPDAIFYLPCLPSDIVWSKFPNLCPVCFGYGLDRGRSGELAARTDFESIVIEEKEMLVVYDEVGTICSCLTRKRFVESRTPEFKRFTKDQLGKLSEIDSVKNARPASLQELEQKLKDIFEPPIYVLTAEEIAFHLLEEIGEVSEALANLMMQPATSEAEFLEDHKQRLRNLREELADVFSWLITMREKAHLILSRATNYTEYARTKHKDDKVWDIVSPVVKGILNDTSNMADLIWLTYGKDNLLACEKCGQRECNQESPFHKQDSGHLWGDKVKTYFPLIRDLEGCSLDSRKAMPVKDALATKGQRKISAKQFSKRKRKARAAQGNQ